MDSTKQTARLAGLFYLSMWLIALSPCCYQGANMQFTRLRLW
jgi:hypothetical protein